MTFVFTIPMVPITSRQEKLHKKGKKISYNSFKLCPTQEAAVMHSEFFGCTGFLSMGWRTWQKRGDNSR